MKYLLVALVLIVIIGVLLLARRGGPSASGDASAPSPDTPKGLGGVTVEADPELVAEHTDRWRKGLLASVAVTRLEKFQYLDYELSESVQTHAVILMPILRGICSDRNAPLQARLNASLLLGSSGHGIEWSPICEALGSGEESIQKVVVNALRMRLDNLSVELPEECHDSLGRLIASTDAVLSADAAWVAHDVKLPGARAKIVAAFENADTLGKGNLAYLVSKLDDPDQLPAIVALYGKVQNEHQALSAVSSFLESQHPSARITAEEELVGILLPRLSTDTFMDFPQSVCADVLRHGTGDKAIELASGVLKGPRDFYLRGHALEALARLQGTAAAPVLLDHLENEKTSSSAIRGLAVALKGTTNESAIAAILRVVSASTSDALRIEAAEAIEEIGGSTAESAAAQARGKPKKPALIRERAFDRLAELQLIDRSILDEARREAAKEEEQLGYDPILDILGQCQILFAFDAETGIIPCRHDHLIESFAKHTRGQFQPLACTERMNQRFPEDYKANYSIAFVHNSKLYSFTAENHGDWYDIASVVSAINFALSESGRIERFLALDTGDQTAIFVYGPPTIVDLLSEFDVSLTTDLSKPMAIGKEFEERVLKKLSEK